MEFEPYRGELVAYCYRMLGSIHEAEDLVQETMLRAWKARDRYDRTRASVRTWLYRVNSALQRARAALADAGDPGEVREPDDPGVRALIGRYMQAFEAADVPALVRLLADEAVLEMPPVPLWYQGSRDYGLFIRRVFEMRGTGWEMRQLTANGGQPALAAYAPEPGGAHRLHTLQVITVAGGRVARNVVFGDPLVFGAFDLPALIPPGEFRQPR